MADYKYETLLVDKQDNVLVITLNRPERLNAVNDTMHEELPDVFARVGQDPEVSAVILTGAGRGFCSGGDVRAMDERGGASRGVPGLGAVSPSGRRLLHNMLWVGRATDDLRLKRRGRRFGCHHRPLLRHNLRLRPGQDR